MRRVFLQSAVEILTRALGDDRVLVLDPASWITDGRSVRVEQPLLAQVSAVARRVRVYAGCPQAAIAHLALDSSLHLLALGPPLRTMQTLVLYRPRRYDDTEPAPPQVHCQRMGAPQVPQEPEPGNAVVVVGGPRRDTSLPLDIHPTDEQLAAAVRHTAGFATATYFVDPRGALPWSLIARHHRAIILARVASPHHLLVSHGTDGLGPALLLRAIEVHEGKK